MYPIIKQSIADDVQNAYDPATGLVRGESSFLDWREQTYPRWMQPVDIYQSENLGTNAVHYQANVVLAQMAAKLGEPGVAAQHQRQAAGHQSTASTSTCGRPTRATTASTSTAAPP